jgi:hypothetical protein
MRLSLSNLHFFVGVGGAFVEDAEGNVTGLDTDDAIGFSVTGASLDLISVKEGGGALRSWTGVAAGINAMGVHGLPSAFELEISILRCASTAGGCSKLDWAAAAPPGDASASTAALAQMRARPRPIAGQLYPNTTAS